MSTGWFIKQQLDKVSVRYTPVVRMNTRVLYTLMAENEGFLLANRDGTFSFCGAKVIVDRSVDGVTVEEAKR